MDYPMFLRFYTMLRNFFAEPRRANGNQDVEYHLPIAESSQAFKDSVNIELLAKLLVNLKEHPKAKRNERHKESSAEFIAKKDKFIPFYTFMDAQCECLNETEQKEALEKMHNVLLHTLLPSQNTGAASEAKKDGEKFDSLPDEQKQKFLNPKSIDDLRDFTNAMKNEQLMFEQLPQAKARKMHSAPHPPLNRIQYNLMEDEPRLQYNQLPDANAEVKPKFKKPKAKVALKSHSSRQHNQIWFRGSCF